MSRFLKDPDAVLDFRWDWSAWLADVNDTIASASLIVPDGLVKDSMTVDGSVVTVWLSGGTAGARYSVTCRVTTTNGRVDDRTVTIAVQDR